MTDTSTLSTNQKIRAPRTAAFAGIAFAFLYGTSMVLVRISLPTDPSQFAWLDTHSSAVSLALSLTPYAGIAFLWFIGVIRDRLDELEDRLFATVFLGSGFMFLTLTFVGAALSGGLLDSYANVSNELIESGLNAYSRSVTHQIVNVYAMRMAGVFMTTLSVIWLRTGLMRRSWAYLTYGLAVVLLVSISYSLWVTLIFPFWVLVVSIYILYLNMRRPSLEAPG